MAITSIEVVAIKKLEVGILVISRQCHSVNLSVFPASFCQSLNLSDFIDTQGLQVLP